MLVLVVVVDDELDDVDDVLLTVLDALPPLARRAERDLIRSARRFVANRPEGESPQLLSRVSRFCGNWLAWTRAAMAAGYLTSADDSFDFSDATSASITADFGGAEVFRRGLDGLRTEVEASMDAPIEARWLEMVEMAVSRAVMADSAPVWLLTEVELMPRSVASAPSMVTLMVSP